MPTYEYECDHCGNRFERYQGIADPPVKRCPKCKHKIRRLFGTGGGILFKGSGFYVTDYRSDGYKAAKRAEKSDSGAPKEAAKPAAKTDAGTKKTGSKDG